MDGYLRAGFRQALSHSHKEWHPGPSPIVDIDVQSHVRLGRGIHTDVLFVAISGHSLSIDRASAILSADDMLANVLAANRSKSLENLYFLVANGIRIEPGGRLHSRKTKELQ